ncbi:MAG: rhodanese-like domain-containing protein [Actinomycetota bacterium]
MRDVETISREELKGKLDRGDDFKLAMALSPWAFEAKRIPGSINIASEEQGLGLMTDGAISPADEIVVYCTGGDCMSSLQAYKSLVELGFTNVRHYPGGLSDWEAAGYPLEGSLAGPTDAVED